MKKFLALLLAAVMVLGCFALAHAEELKADDIPDTITSADGTYEVAFVTDVGSLKDKSFNEGTWNGVKLYAAQNGLTYKYYQPANESSATDQDRIDAMVAACEGGAKVVVCAGFLQEAALRTAATRFPKVNFIFIDGYQLADANGNTLTNVAGIAFKEEQAGYLAGYAVVKEGFTKLGFSGGGGGTNPACDRYGYGFVQGANDAAAEKGVNVECRYTWQYGGSFSSSPELQTMMSGWYESGTEVVFSCGGKIFDSISAAASANDAFVVGVDVDQSIDTANNTVREYVVTSAMKGISEATFIAIGKNYDGKWEDIGGKGTSYGIKDDAVGLPVDTWSLENFSVDEYNALVEAMKNDTVKVDATNLEGGAIADVQFSNLTVQYE